MRRSGGRREGRRDEIARVESSDVPLASVLFITLMHADHTCTRVVVSSRSEIIGAIT